MHRTLSALVTALGLVVVPFASGVAQQRVVPFFGGGFATGTGDWSTDSRNGWVAYGGVDLPIGGAPEWSVGTTLSYAHLPYRGGFSEAGNGTSLVVEVQYLFLTASAARFKPYLRAGTGMLRQKYDPGNTAYASNVQSSLAFSGGAGVEVEAAGMVLAFGAHYVGASPGGFVALGGRLGYGGAGGAAARVEARERATERPTSPLR